MNVLVINAGSSSLKYQLLNVDTQELFAKGNCERIGIPDSFIGHIEAGKEKETIKVDLPNHGVAIKLVIEKLLKLGISIDGIGHRVVQGSVYFPDSAIVDEKNLPQVRAAAPLAPLHNYAEADVIEYCLKNFPELKNVIVCDTSFHSSMPEYASRYALPYDLSEKLNIRKYGAHGTSHRFIWRACEEFTQQKTGRLISCHLGSGSSLCAIKDGKSLDTTMGLTPLDGLVMGTRCGTLDPALVFYLVREGGYSIDEIDTILNKKSGLLGISGLSSDARDIEEAAQAGNKRCQLAIDMFSYRASSLISWMANATGGVDTLAFTAGIGENSPVLRSAIAARLGWLGLSIDEDKNKIRSSDIRDISAPDSQIRVLVVPTNEEYMIALDVQRLLSQG